MRARAGAAATESAQQGRATRTSQRYDSRTCSTMAALVAPLESHEALVHCDVLGPRVLF